VFVRLKQGLPTKVTTAPRLYPTIFELQKISIKFLNAPMVGAGHVSADKAQCPTQRHGYVSFAVPRTVRVRMPVAAHPAMPHGLDVRPGAFAPSSRICVPIEGAGDRQ
jgi:hypothetical protein